MHIPKIKHWVGFSFDLTMWVMNVEFWVMNMGWTITILRTAWGTHGNLGSTIRASLGAWWEHTGLNTSMGYQMLQYFVKFTFSLCQLHIGKMQSWHSPILKLKLSGLHSHVDNSTMLFAKSSSSLHLPTAWMFFFSLPKLFPQKIRLPPLFSPFFFFTKFLGLPPLAFLSFSLFVIFLTCGSLKLGKSPFKIQTTK